MAINKFVSTRNRNKNKNRLIPLMGGLDDGSTLSLDFTAMSSLDSRFTFSRSSPATFINSQGRVQYATHNFLPNTVWTSTSIPTGWTAGVGTGQVTYHGDGSITMGVTGSTQRLFLTPSTAITVANGLKYRIGFLVQTSTGSPLLGDIVASNGGTDTYYINGEAAGSGDLVLGGDYVEIIATATGSTMQPRIGVGVIGNPTSSPISIRVTAPMMNIGNEVLGGNSNYVPNTATSAYQTARFDYDPTTLAPRGLLIEGSVTNLCLQSAAVRSSGWTPVGLTTQGPSITAPDGTSSGIEMVPSNGTVAGNAYSVQSVTASAATSYTLSVWIKPIGTAFNTRIRLTSLPGGTDAITATINNANGTIASLGTGTNWTSVYATSTPYPNGWYRIALTGNTPSGTTQLQIVLLFSGTGDGTTGAYFWGAQLEAGSGATSYIPTGSSTVQRAADSCSMTGTNFSSWFNTIGTFVVEQDLSGPFITSDRVGIGLGTYSSGTSSFGFFRNNTTTVGTAIWGSGGTGYQESTISVATRSPARSGFTLDWSGATRSNRSFANGTVAASLVSTTGSITVDRMFIGANSATGISASRDWMNGHIRSIKFWPTVLPNATIQSLTQ